MISFCECHADLAYDGTQAVQHSHRRRGDCCRGLHTRTNKGLAVDQPLRKRILIIEDDPEELRLIEYLLKRPELELLAAATASTGARLLRSGMLPDLLLVDLMLGDVPGVECVKQMRSRSQFNQLPVIVLADATRPMEIRAALVAGADRYVTKTYMGNNLIKTVFEVLAAGRTSAAADA